MRVLFYGLAFLLVGVCSSRCRGDEQPIPLMHDRPETAEWILITGSRIGVRCWSVDDRIVELSIGRDGSVDFLLGAILGETEDARWLGMVGTQVRQQAEHYLGHGLVAHFDTSCTPPFFGQLKARSKASMFWRPYDGSGFSLGWDSRSGPELLFTFTIAQYTDLARHADWIDLAKVNGNLFVDEIMGSWIIALRQFNQTARPPHRDSGPQGVSQVE
jgi:hypothetical protein